MQSTDAQGQSDARLARLDRRLRRTQQMDTVAKCPLGRDELSRKRALVRKKHLERKRSRLSAWEKGIRPEVANDVTMERARQKWFLVAKTL